MELNKIIFPAPTPSYEAATYPNMVWIPRNRFFSLKRFMKPLQSTTFVETYHEAHSSDSTEQSFSEQQIHIPCVYNAYSEGSDKILLYFHGNAEDIGYASEFTRRISQGLKINVLSVEYPGYGVYQGEPSAKAVLEDAEIVFDFLTCEMDIKPENIYLLGRSIGSGPATYLAANRNPGLLVLMSPYTSIRAVVKSIAGSWAQFLVAERFRNVEEIEKVKCPSFFLHGKKDRLIPSSHTTDLFAKCTCVAGMNLSANMTHNEFNMVNDVLRPLRKFLRQIGYENKSGTYRFPTYTTTDAVLRGKKKTRTLQRSATTIRQRPESALISSSNCDYKVTKTKSALW